MVAKITNTKQERVAGMDFMPAILKMAEKEQLPVFFFGTSDPVLKAIKSRILSEVPKLPIAGMLAPPFGDQTEAENAHYCQTIINSGAKLVLVALGCPRQEKWMAKNTHLINAPMLGVGGAFPVYAGLDSRAPEWMQNLGLEWFHRLITNPGRLWKRYLFTNTRFIIKILPLLLKHKGQ